MALAAARPGARLEAEAEGGGHRIDGIAPDAGLVAALAAWCALADRLIVEMRTGGGTLEETYIALVGGPAEAGS